MPSNHVFGRRYAQRGSHGVTSERRLQYNQSTMYTRVCRKDDFSILTVRVKVLSDKSESALSQILIDFIFQIYVAQ